MILAARNLSGRRSASPSCKKRHKAMVRTILFDQTVLEPHARAAPKLVRVASAFQSQVQLRRPEGDVTADANVNPECAHAGCRPWNRDCKPAPMELTRKRRWTQSSGYLPKASAEVEAESSLLTQSAQEIRFRGLGVSEGIVIGQVLRHARWHPARLPMANRAG